MTVIQFHLKLALRGPVLTAATNPGGLGVDAPFARRAADGKLCFPGTLVKGKLLQAWTELEGFSSDVPTKEERESWFGRQSGNEKEAGDFEPLRGRARFSDLADESKAGSAPVRVRIRMDEQRGSADDGMMEQIESPYNSGEEAVFEGRIDFHPAGAGEASRFRKAVQIGLYATPSFGAERGIGFGRLIRATIDEVVCSTTSARPSFSPDAATTAGWALSTDDVFCIAERQPVANIFRSAGIIPGSAVKGAVAQMISLSGGAAQFPLLYQNLSRIRFRHLRPVKRSEPLAIPPAIPLSVAATSQGICEAVFAERAVLVGGESPRFQPDWKDEDYELACGVFGTHSMNRELRVRTRMDSAKRRAKDENLFAYESVKPEGFQWAGNIDLYHVDKQACPGVLLELETLVSGGLAGIGKTKTRFSVEPAGRIPDRFESTTVPDQGMVVVQLNTPALLGSPSAWRNARTAGDLHAVYAGYWSKVSECIELSHYFALQEFAGGFYLHGRFRGGAEYQPWVLTKAGSVFVLRVKDPGAARKLLEELVVTGLPLEAGLQEEFELGRDRFAMWSRCPYVPENGFGEIGVNLHAKWGIPVLEAPHA